MQVPEPDSASDKPQPLHTWEVTVDGYVQGVGYRYFAQAEAARLGVRGWVRNERDGSVHAVLQHESEQVLHELLLRLKQGPPHGMVTACDLALLETSERFARFEIRR